MHRRAADARTRSARRGARQARGAPRSRTNTPPARPIWCSAASTSTAPNRLWVADFTYVRDLVRHRLRRVRHRRLLPTHPGLAGRDQHDAPRWCSTRWSRRSGPAAAPASPTCPAWSTTPTPAASTRRSRSPAGSLDAGVDASVGSVGDAYDNALAETTIGLFKTELIHRRGPWRDPRPGRTRHPRIRRLVQPPPTAQRRRGPTTSRLRDPLRSQPDPPHRGGYPTHVAAIKPGAVQ